ncbi:MAG: CusA/CzcA family heavy metal efflux RND transporter [Nevskiaceae bacterium]|nr:MAG: CusA/CzcA family heavy metal efflux RND transporter [Nevskiaceae bacterium]TBR71837.1 MAG: CusA/CzcA family heavy metal efflux RND transporter [Nevskiaceae bacterium]
MIDAIVRLSIGQRWLMLGLMLVLIGTGVWSYQQLPIDAVPDITNVQVQINTKAPGYSPLEAEKRITFPVETALYGLPGLAYTRSISRYGLSQVTVVFEDNTDIYHARNLIDARLGAIQSSLPAGMEPTMGPIATGLGEIFMYTVAAESDARQQDGAAYDATRLRELQEWVIRPQLMQVKGVVEVNTIGGFDKQYQVIPDSRRMLQMGVTLEDITRALKANNQNQGAGYIENNGQQLLVRALGRLQGVTDIADVVVVRHDTVPVRVQDVAEIRIGHQTLRSGAATRDGKEVVLGTAMMLIGENPQQVANALAAKVAEIQPSLPKGVRIDIGYSRATLVDQVLRTIQKNLLEGALLVIVVLLLLLGNLRAALITAAVIPLSLLATFTGMLQTGVAANLMSLGALDFGLIVDGTVIIVENCIRRLALVQAQQGRRPALAERLQLVREATTEVIRPALFGAAIITVVYLPIFTLTGVEGKMFHPMAATVVMALVAAMLLSLFVVPAAVAVFMGGKIGHKESPIVRGAKHVYRPLLERALRLRWWLLGGSALLVGLCLWLATTLGSVFIPQLNEGDIALHALRITGTGLQQSIEMQEMLEKRLSRFPQVQTVFAKLGTPDVATDPMPPSVADNFVILKPRAQWPDPSLPREELVVRISEAVNQLPGNKYEFTQPIEMRFNELISGVRADLAIKVFGDDLGKMAATADAIADVVKTVPGAADTNVEQVAGLPVLTVIPERTRLARYGLDVSELQDRVSTAVAGQSVGVIYEGDRRFDLVVRLPQLLRDNPERLADLPLSLPGGGYVPLEDVARIVLKEVPAQISRENGKRRVVVTANVRGRDLGSFVQTVRAKVAAQVKLPEGYWLAYDGTYQQLQSASQRLAIVVPLALVIILALLLMALRSFKDALIVFTAVPLALTGGVLSLWLRGMPLSLTAAVGFIALSGVAVLNGLVMLAFIRDLREHGLGVSEAVIEGAMERLRPVLMTALVAGLGFVPMAFNVGIGAEVQRPLATVVIGGIVSSTLLTLLVLPVLYQLVHGRERRAVVQG